MSNSKWTRFDKANIEAGTYMVYARETKKSGRSPYLTGHIGMMKVSDTNSGSKVFIIDGCFIWDTVEPDFVSKVDVEEFTADLPIEFQLK